jgi:hypothetical protein
MSSFEMINRHYYGIQYEIHLIREIDYFGELLPIWANIRSKIEMEKDTKTGNYKLIVIPCEDFYEKLLKNYVSDNTNHSYLSDDDKNNEEYIRNNNGWIV